MLRHFLCECCVFCIWKNAARVTLCVGGGVGWGGSATSCTTHLAKHYLTEQSVAVILRLLHTALPSISLSNKVNASHNDSDTGKAEIESSPIFPVAPTAQLGHSQRIDCALASATNSSLATLEYSGGQMNQKSMSLIVPIASKPCLVNPFRTNPWLRVSSNWVPFDMKSEIIQTGFGYRTCPICPSAYSLLFI